MPWKMYKEHSLLEGLLETLQRCLPLRGYSAGEGEKQGEWKENAYPYVLENV